jgi:hypothetical protein
MFVSSHLPGLLQLAGAIFEVLGVVSMAFP